MSPVTSGRVRGFGMGGPTARGVEGVGQVLSTLVSTER